MKTTVLLLCAAFIACTAQQANAKVWRVNNNSNYDGSTKWGSNFGGTQSYPVFATINQAIGWSSVVNGDTIHIEGSAMNYSGADVLKKLVIIGPGFFLNQNPNVSTNALSASIGDIHFGSGSTGSQLIGVYALGNFGINISASDITIKRCRIDRSISFNDGLSNISIVENFFANIDNNTQSAVLEPNFTPVSYLVFDNNICKSPLILYSNGATATVQEVNNNTFDCPAISNSPSIYLNTASFQNNILKTAAATVNINNNTNNNVSYCVSSSSTGQFGTSNHNIIVTNINSIFVASGTSDGTYQIKDGSVADNSGSDGTDRGAFGGAPENSYTLSGLPPIPTIYQIITTGVAGPSGLPVTIKARTIK